jgi:hypothetical protein
MRMFARTGVALLAAALLGGCGAPIRPAVLSTSPASPQASEAPLPAGSTTLAPGDPLLSAAEMAPTTQPAMPDHSGHSHGRVP